MTVNVRLAAVVAFALGCGCLPRVAVQRQASRTTVAVLYLMDREQRAGVVEVPAQVKAQVTAALEARNLEAREVPLSSAAAALQNVRDSGRRYGQLTTLSGDAPLLLLVETRAAFFSQLSGRYRWTVNARLTAGRKGASADPSTESFEQAVFLDYEHEQEPEALTSAASAIAERAGSLFDSFLSAESVSKPVTTASADSIYFVLVDRFDNGDKKNDGEVDLSDAAAFHGGDLQGVIDRLDYLQRLGVKTVWLSPVSRMRTAKFFGHGAFHGYWVEDLGEVEPRFGSKALLRQLSDQLHQRGMKLMMDLVINHTGPASALSQQKPAWFHHQGALEDWSDPKQLTDRDVKGLPDLAQENEEVHRFLLERAKAWIDEVHPDGFRLDAVKHIPLAYWAKFNAQLHQYAGPHFTLLGEMLESDASVVAKVEREGGFDQMFDFPLQTALIDVFCRDQSPARLASTLSLDRLYADPTTLVTQLDNHDLPRLMSLCHRDLGRVRQALLVQLTARGTPGLTYGTEAGLEGEQEPENRKDMAFGRAPVLEQWVSSLLRLRGVHPSLTLGAPLLLAADDQLFAYARVTPGELTVIAVNRGPAPLTVALPAEVKAQGGIDLMSGQPVDPQRLSVPAGETLVAKFIPSDGAADGFAALFQAQSRRWHRPDGSRTLELEQTGAANPVYVVGSAPELGSWNPARGAGPFHGGKLQVSLPVGTVAEFKLVTRPVGGPVRWEEGNNRVLFVREGQGPLAVRLAWNQTAPETGAAAIATERGTR